MASFLTPDSGCETDDTEKGFKVKQVVIVSFPPVLAISDI